MKISELNKELEQFDERVLNMPSKSKSVQLDFSTPQKSIVTIDSIADLLEDENTRKAMAYLDSSNGMSGQNSASSSIRDISRKLRLIGKNISVLENPQE